jgi:hypothetical protein
MRSLPRSPEPERSPRPPDRAPANTTTSRPSAPRRNNRCPRTPPRRLLTALADATAGPSPPPTPLAKRHTHISRRTCRRDSHHAASCTIRVNPCGTSSLRARRPAARPADPDRRPTRRKEADRAQAGLRDASSTPTRSDPVSGAARRPIARDPRPAPQRLVPAGAYRALRRELPFAKEGVAGRQVSPPRAPAGPGNGVASPAGAVKEFRIRFAALHVPLEFLDSSGRLRNSGLLGSGGAVSGGFLHASRSPSTRRAYGHEFLIGEGAVPTLPGPRDDSAGVQIVQRIASSASSRRTARRRSPGASRRSRAAGQPTRSDPVESRARRDSDS